MTRLRLRIGLLATAQVLAVLPGVASAAGTRTCLGAEVTILGTSGDDVLVGTSGPDVIAGLGGNDIVRSKGGNDIVCGGRGDDVLIGGSGRDLLTGGPGNDEIGGGGGGDDLRGRSGDDVLQGDKGADLLLGGTGSDELTGGSQGDRVDGGRGDDVIWEHRSNDTHLAEGSQDAIGDLFTYTRLNMTPRRGWILWRPTAGGDNFEQGHEGTLSITNRSDGLLMIERIDPERYLLGIAEMPYSWEPAALQSQAIAARTYLASTLSNPRYGPMAVYGFDICDHAACQVYKGTKYGWLESWEAAVADTAGQILLYGGAPAATFYHSTSGETTRNIEDVWAGAVPVPYLQAVPVPEQDSVFANWSYKVPLDVFMEILSESDLAFDGLVTVIKTIETAPGDGPYRLRIRTTEGTTEYPITTIQIALNRRVSAELSIEPPAPRELTDLLPPLLGSTLKQAAISPTFTLKLRSDGNVVVRGEGWGHQIGLSQYGANALAKTGATAAEILNHFYTGLLPEEHAELIPDLIDVGLFYDNGATPIVLRPTKGYRLRNDSGLVRKGTGGTITITRYGDDAVAVRIDD